MSNQRQSAGDSGATNARRGTANEARWDEILAAAAEEFYERGYRAARLQDIAERVGLLTGSLYYYIDSKEDLLFALVQSTHRLGVETSVEDEATARSDAATRLRAFIQRQMRLMHDLEAPAGAVQRDLPFLEAEHRAQISEMRQHLHRFVYGIIEQGIADGDFEPTIDIGVATNTIFGLLRTTPDWAHKPGRLTWSEIGDWYSRLALRGLAVRGKAESAHAEQAG